MNKEPKWITRAKTRSLYAADIAFIKAKNNKLECIKDRHGNAKGQIVDYSYISSLPSDKYIITTII